MIRLSPSIGLILIAASAASLPAQFTHQGSTFVPAGSGSGNGATLTSTIAQTPVGEGSAGASGLLMYHGFWSPSSETPLYVSLERLEVIRLADGETLEVHWETSFEESSAGFHVYRATESGGEFTPTERLTGELIPSLGTGGAGGSYLFRDPIPAPQGTQAYFLEEVDLAGIRKLYGPVHAPEVKASAPGWEWY